MEYQGLTDEDREAIRAQHTIELEATRYRLELQEEEEPGGNQQRTAQIEELTRRIDRNRAILAGNGDADHVPESSEHTEGGPA